VLQLAEDYRLVRAMYLAGDDDVELLPMLVEILTGALLRLVGADEVRRQIDEWLDVRAARLTG
jgi:hypothetical protein